MSKSKLIKKIDNQIYFRIFLAFLWSKEILLNYFRGFLLKIPVLSATSDYIIPAVLFLMFLLSYKTIAERLRGSDFVFVMGCILVYVASYLFFKRNRDFFRMEWVDFIIGCLPFYFVGVAMRADEEETIIRWLYWISCISTVAFTVYILFINEMEDLALSAGDMDSAYNMLPHACLLFYFMIKDFRLWKCLLFFLAVVCILMMGTRGALLCLLVFIVLATAVTIRFQRPIVLLCMSVVCILFVTFSELTDLLIEGAYSIGETFGLSTRIFDKLLSGNFVVSDARVYLRQRVNYYLLANPLVGYGIYGDRVVTGGQYAHNLFVEIFAQFGLLMGTILVVSLVVLSYRGIRYIFKSGDRNAQLVSLLLMSCCFKLMVSSSYLREPFFWLLIGYFAAVCRERSLSLQLTRNSTKKSKLIK